MKRLDFVLLAVLIVMTAVGAYKLGTQHRQPAIFYVEQPIVHQT